VTRQGIATVARQEFTIRIRAGRWRWLLGAWFVALLLFTLFVHFVVAQTDPNAANQGVVVYGSLTLLVLGLALLIVPMLSAQSVNGDRERGTLATLQVSLLTAGDIAVGKLVAAWGTALVFLALTLPLDLYAMALGGVPLRRVVVVTLVLALLLGTVAALSLCLSALLARTTTSGVLAYLLVFALTIGTLITFGLATALTNEDYQTTEYSGTRSRPDKVWWVLAPNPFVVVADAAPQLDKESAAERQARLRREARGEYRPDLRDSDPLGAIGRGVRTLRNAPRDRGPEDTRHRPLWPFGLAVDVAVGGAALWLTARRLQTPSRDLPRGQRVA
jgi:ABC-2 type transport system permease protein